MALGDVQVVYDETRVATAADGFVLDAYRVQLEWAKRRFVVRPLRADAPSFLSKQELQFRLWAALRQRPAYLRRLAVGGVAQVLWPLARAEFPLVRCVRELESLERLARYARQLTAFDPKVVPLVALRLYWAGVPPEQPVTVDDALHIRLDDGLPPTAGRLRFLSVRTLPAGANDATDELLLLMAARLKPDVASLDDALLHAAVVLANANGARADTQEDDGGSAVALGILWLALMGIVVAPEVAYTLPTDATAMMRVCEQLARLHPDNVPPLIV